MKNLIVFAMLAAALIIFNGCQKEELTVSQLADDVQPQYAVNDPLFEGLNEIAFSVEDNRLVFENEEEFQKGIDFLANLGDKNFSTFEKIIGFESYRKFFEGKDSWADNLEDKLFATLINPDGFIQVKNFLFEIDFEDEKVLAYELFENEFELKSSIITKNKDNTVFDWDDDIFAILANEPNLKSVTSDYCQGNQLEYSYPDFIKAKVDFNNYGLYHTLTARLWNSLGSQYTLNYLRLKTVDIPYNPPVVPSGITSRCFWINKKTKDEIVRDFIEYNKWEVQSRPYSSTRRLKGYRLDVEFWWRLNSWDPTSYDNLRIECHNY